MSFTFVNLHIGLSLGLGLAAACGLTGCGDSTALGEEATISGQFVDWRDGAGVLRTSIAGSVVGSPALTSGIVDASGAFTLKLPSGAQVAPAYETLPFNCTGKPDCPVQNSQPAARRALLNFSVQILQSGQMKEYLVLHYKKPGAGGLGYVYYQYFDRDVDVTGTVPNNKPPGAYTLGIHARTGWNVVVTSFDASDLSSVTEATATPPADYLWTVVDR